MGLIGTERGGVGHVGTDFHIGDHLLVRVLEVASDVVGSLLELHADGVDGKGGESDGEE